MTKRAAALAGVALAGLTTGAYAQESRPTAGAAADGLPPEFKRVLPRGRIPGIRKPRYVSASEATIRDEAWVLGVVIEGQARAYSLNLLNAHEVVNDTIGETAFATVW